MAAQLPRPGVEIIQEFQSTSPTIVVPTLVPCNVAPFFEIIEVLNADGTLNDDSELDTPYAQLGLTVVQSSFPSPRGNIDEVNVDEDSIRVFFDFGGNLLELSRTSGFLAQSNIATQPFVEGSQTGPFNLNGQRLIVALDAHTAVGTGLPSTGDVPTSANVNIDFTADGLTIAQVVAAINAIVPGLASDSPANPGQLRLTSPSYGAGASVLVRATGSANTTIGFSTVTDEIAIGGGYYAIDDADSDLLSPRIEVYTGSAQRLLTAANSGGITPPDFTTLFIQAGDDVMADGVAIGTVQQVFTGRLVMSIEQSIFGADSPFAPRYVWFQANGLSSTAPASSTAANTTGTNQVAAATQAYIVAGAAGTYAVGAGESFDIDVTIAGVAQTTEVIGTGAGWASQAAAITSINTQAVNFEAYPANNFGDEVDAAVSTRIGLRTLSTNTGSGAGITMSAQSAGMTIGFSGLPVSDVGENQRYRPGTPAIAIAGGAWSTLGGASIGNTVIYDADVLGVTQATETITWTANFAADAAGLALAIADWNAQALNTEAYESNAAGVETTGGGFFAVRTLGENVGTTAQIDVTGGTDVALLGGAATFNGTDTDLNGLTFLWQMDGNLRTYSVLFVADEDDGGTSLQQVLDAINGETPNVASASTSVPPALLLTSGMVGEGSQITITTGTANAVLGFTDNSTVNGNGRPLPDLVIDISGNAVIQNQILRSPLDGTPFANGGAPIHFAYTALRLDVSPRANNPSLLVINDTAQLQSIADPISSDNPGALMTFLTLLNSPGTAATAIGVPETSPDAPDGTPIGYAECFTFLESEEVYALSLASQNPVIHQAGLSHVRTMSEPERKGERILFANAEIPSRAQPTLLASGNDANTSATPGLVTLEVNIAPALIAAGINPASVNPSSGAIVNEVYLDLGGDNEYYLVQSVANGTDVTLRTTFATGDGNADSFYATTAPSGVISDSFTVAIRGAELLLADGSQDKDGVSTTVQAIGQAYGERRFFYTFPDQVGINATGLEQVVPGYYATSAIIGMVASLPPQQGFTNFPITGLTQVVGSSGVYSETQLNVMAAGGVYILIQDVDGAPVTCRHQLSTDLSSIEVRELSITKVVDFTAKFLRAGLRNFIGRSNITQSFLDQLSSVVQGIMSFLIESGVLIGADVNNVIQDADSPDTVLIDITLDVPYPCNYIRVTLVI